jgi:hypothetical protein
MGAVAVTAALSGLAPSTAYHYRIVAVNASGETRGADAEFTTALPPATPPSGPAGGGGSTSPQPTSPAPVKPIPLVEALVKAPLLARITTHVAHRNLLELHFHLSVRARVRLLAKRGRRVVATTGWRTLAAGERKLTLRLNVHHWPKKLEVQTHPLGPLPLITAKEKAALS